MLTQCGVAWRNPRLSARIPELDGLRGLAILLVLVWHYLVETVHAAPHTWQAYSLVPLRLTWSGVDLLFVLSGFLIGGILYDAKVSDGYYRTFYLRRIHRIFPIYFIWIILFTIGLRCVGPKSLGPLKELFNLDLPVWSYPLFLQNIFMSWRQTFGAQWMAITWSLAVEEQFYLLLPFLVRKLSNRGITLLAIASLIAAPLFRSFLSLSGNLYFGPYTLLLSRADAFGFGILVAIACRNETAWTWIAQHRRIFSSAFLTLCWS